MKRIVFFTENYAKGGGNRYLIDLINSLPEWQYEIFLYSNIGGIDYDDTARLRRKTEINHLFFITRAFLLYKINFFIGNKYILLKKLIGISFLFFEPFLFLVNILIFIRFFKKNKPDIIFCCNGGYPAAKSCLAMVVAANFLGIHAVMSIVSMPQKRHIIFYLLESLEDFLVWRACDFVVVNALAISKSLISTRGLPKNKVYLIYNGVEENAEDVHIVDSRNQSDFVIGLVARLDYEKGVIFLFEAFILLLKKYKNIRLILVGQGNASNELEIRRREMGLEGRIDLPGYYKGNISSLISSFDIYVFPSLWEGLPYSILEALRAGCVIVATNVGGIPEAICNQKNGILIQPKSAIAIADAIERLMNEASYCETISRNAKTKFESTFTLAKMEERVKGMLEIINH